MVKQSKSNSLKSKSFRTNKSQMNILKNKKTKNKKKDALGGKKIKKIKDDLDFDKLEKAYDEFEDEDFEELEDEDFEGAEDELEMGDEEIYAEDNLDEEENFDDDEEDSLDEEENDDEEEDETTVTEEGNSKKEKKGSIKENNLLSWEKELSYNSTAISAFKNIQNALNLAVENIEGGDSKDTKTDNNTTVSEPAVFNNIVKICLTSVPAALHRLFELKTLSDRPVKNKKWSKLSSVIKKYLKNIISLVKYISEPSLIQNILKKGIIPMLTFFNEFSYLSWQLTKQIATFWCTSDEKIRVLSVVALFRLITAFRNEQKEKVLKLLYVSYVKNCKFTSPQSLPMIDFMRMSMVELYNMDQAIAYRHGFIYIRQLASHLRSAMLIQKKERLQLVYNWQFVHCLHFWCELLWKTHPSKILGPLIYPVVQICHGLLTLMKSPAYFPLTFHIANMLTELSGKTDIFIPILPYLLEILSSQKLKMKPKKASMKPFEWECIIKVSAAQLAGTAFYNGLIEQFFNSSVNYLNTQCHTIGFPELVFPFALQLKSFLKKCKVAAHSKKVKQLLDKINENSQFISDRRKEVTFKLTDSEAIRHWEIEASQVPPPLRSFCKQWNKLRSKLKETEGVYSESAKDEFSISSLRKRQRDPQEDSDEEDILKPKKKKQNPDESNEKKKYVKVENSKKEHTRNYDTANVNAKSESPVKGKITYFQSDDEEDSSQGTKGGAPVKGKITRFNSDDEFEADVVKEMKL